VKLKLIACDIFHREMEAAVASSRNSVDLEFLAQGLHNEVSGKMCAALQEAVDKATASGLYEAILLGYALCGNGLVGVRARSVPLIIPRAHDCITLFFGTRARYTEYFYGKPGTYFKTSGWLERVTEDGTSSDCCGGKGQLTFGAGPGMSVNYDELVEKFGEEDAKYVMEELGGQGRNYSRIAYIEMGVEPPGMEEVARAQAAKSGWEFEKVRGDMALIRRLVDGPWPEEDFLRVAPGASIIQKYDDSIIGAEAPDPSRN
jgi:hypothetical protein